MGNKLNLALAVARRMPKARISRANIAVTFRCNHRCQMCGIWKENSNHRVEGEISGFEVDRIIVHNHLLWVSLTGGEPFLNRDIERILRESMIGCSLVSIVSNGSQPERISDVVTQSLKWGKGLLVFSISLEGNEQAHDYITGSKGSYKQVIRTIELLKHINNKRLYLGVEHLLSNYNYDYQEYVEEIAREYKIGITYTKEQRSPYYHNVNGVQPVIVSSPKYRFSAKPFDMMHNLFVYGLRHSDRKLCEAGRYSAFIDPYANVYPCLPYAPSKPIKNLRNTNYVIGDISKEAEELYKTCHSPCFTPCEVYASMLFRPWRLL